MTLRQALDGAERQLTAAGLDNGRGEAEILLGRLVAASRAGLYLRGDEPFDTGLARTLAAWILRRQGGEPLQYVIGEAAYRDLVLEVGPGVFIPRPETELLVDETLAFLRARPAGSPPPRVLECCTGSGAIALAIAAERPDAIVVATELSPRALAYAARNRARLAPAAAARVHLLHGDLGSALAGRFDVLVANPPYIAEAERPELPRDVLDHEPHLALFAAKDGMAVIERLVEEGARLLRPGGLLAIEIGSGQGARVTARLVADDRFASARVARDLAARDRIAFALRRSAAAVDLSEAG